MTQSVSFDPPKKRLPLADVDVDAELRQFEADERARLGLEDRERWVEDMANLGFTKSERANVTLLVGGLTMAHDYFVEAALKRVGYSVLALDAPDNDALRYGKEFGNRGQCNPTYFTVGNLVKFLVHLRDDKGMSPQEIISKFVFLTAGACGPCRFGMYVTEYRKALRDAGFDGFRVMLFQQQGGLSQATGEESGLELNPKFFLALVKAILAGDVLNAVGYRIRPYEVEAGATDRAIDEAKRICHEALSNGKSILGALYRSRKVLEQVEVDRTMIKPRVAIIGEFWAMTTEGDGNYQLQRFLEKEGAEVDIQLVTAWLLYNIWEVTWDTENRAELRADDGGRFGHKGLGEYGVAKRKAALWAADKGLRVVFQTYAWFGGLHGYHLPNMADVADAAMPHYNNDLRGGEGHMEVGKLILNVVKQKATMTLSVKPFGCMPSGSVSDGVQSLITEKYPGTIFCAVETSGDGAVNFYSRVQMYLFKARQAAEAEVLAALASTGRDLETTRAYLRAHPRLASSLHRAPHAGGCTTTDLVKEAAHLAATPLWRRSATSLSKNAALAGRGLLGAAKAAPRALTLAARASLELRDIAKENGPAVVDETFAKAKARLIEVAFGLKSDPASQVAAAAG
ncbi:MAG: 2-hydroxyglutaryl-CoA dehydratase [Myxococcales bacterium]|nr:2-hydroxyglutaryl-CoA dehydratase [Myxococcales bacterium]